jgi:hypothetical protein
MSIGSAFVGLAVAAVVVAYLALPFRRRRADVEVDRAIEAWVAQVRADRDLTPDVVPSPASAALPDQEQLGFCPQCGRSVAPDDLFCSRCGRRLRGGAE